MTIDQHIQWIALPAGAEADGTLRLSVFVAPRLRSDEGPTLAPFVDFLDWPARIRDATFAIEVGGVTVPASVASEPPDSALWTALFAPQTPLTPFVFDDFADRPFVTYSVREVLGELRNLYAQTAAAAPDDLPQIRGNGHTQPPVRGLLDLFDGLRAVIRGPLYARVNSPESRAARVGALLEQARAGAAARRAVGATHGGDLLEPLPPDGTVPRQFERALFFHSRPELEPVAMPAGGEHYVEAVDFHGMLSALGDHPWLMRRLGLVVDLIVPAAAVPEATSATPGEVAVLPTWTSALGTGSVDVLPHTAYAHQTVEGGTCFAAAPRHPDPTAPPDAPPTGLLPLPPSTFTLEQVDVDGAVLKALNLTATLDAVAQRPDPAVKPLHEPEQTGLPALRTSGLALVEAGRAASLQAMFSGHLASNTAIEQGSRVTFFAEDLVRGYRLDVLDAHQGIWRSLHHRVVTATTERPASALGPMADEGFFQLSLAGRPTVPGQAPDLNGELYVHENLITWDGWSLSAPRPGKALSRDPRAPTDADPATHPAYVKNDPFTAMGLTIETGMGAGTLPRLRFGRIYRARVRTVDLAGNGATLDEADHRLASAAVTTAPPATDDIPYLRFEPVVAPTLVPAQRFGEGASLRRLVIRSNAGATAGEYATAFNASDLVTGGTHPGYADHDDRHVAAPKGSFQLVERHGLLDAVMGSDGTSPGSDRQAAIAAAYEIARREKGTFDDPSLPTAEVIELSAEPAAPQRYVVHHEAQLELPYLPDPLAAGALFFGLPGRAAAEPLQVLYDAARWYEATPLRLRLADGAGAPEWDADARLLTVYLPQATSANIRVCSLLGGDMGQMGILRWCQELLHGEDADRTIHAMMENRSWLITPWHQLELVHAVQQPLIEPRWNRFEVTRGPESLSADLFGEVVLDASSTEKVDLVADWSETVDDLAQPGPEVRQAHAHVFELPLKVAAQGRTDIDPHEVACSLRHDHLLTFFTAVRQRELPGPNPHVFGDTHYRRIKYQIVATSAFREDFPPDWAKRPDLLSRTSLPQEVDVLCSSPPATPKVLYVVPTLGWTTSAADGATVRHRRGGGLRVYLERPWFSSGDGELLGVVVGGLTSPIADDYHLITLLGQDPIRDGAPLAFATPARFRNATLVAESIEPLELRQPVAVVAYTPAYDPDTRRWFCDLELDTLDAYMPFVRLALARYQPHAQVGCALSRIALADIVQTTPDRALTVTREGEELQITVAGVSYTAIHSMGAPRSDDAALARMVARLEHRDASIPDEFLGWQAVDGAEVVLTRALAGIAATWTGRLPLPPGDGGARRLTVVEEEYFAIDEQTPGKGNLGARVVYADTLEI